MNQVIKSKRIEKLVNSKKVENFEFINPTESEMAQLSKLFYTAVPETASYSVFEKLLKHNSSILMVFQNKVTKKLGVVVILPLTVSGHIALADNRFDCLNPKLDHVCRPGQVPSAIYIWATGIMPHTTLGLVSILNRLNAFPYTGKPIFAKSSNKKSERLLSNIGFTKGAFMHGSYRADLFEYKRNHTRVIEEKAVVPLYDTFCMETASKNSIGIKVVHTSDELSRAMMIRGATYIGEQSIPFSEDLDGNDYSSTHLLAYVGKEPVGCIRMRFFAGFTKLERLAVLPKFRSMPVATRIIRAAIELGRKKGYQRFYGQVEREIIPIWKRFGFVVRDTTPIKYLTDKEYFEGDMFIERSQNAITPLSGPNTLLRREGCWHNEEAFEI